MTKKVSRIAGTLLLILSSYAMAQSDRPVRVRVDVVPVTVVVTDEQGKPVTHLGKTDFSVFENGVKQQLQYFQILTPGAAGLPADARQFAQTAGFTDGLHQRSFLILLGRGRHASVFGDLGDFVLTRLNPGDQVAVVAHGFATPFLTDHSRVVAILNRCRTNWDTIEQRLEQATRSELAVVYGGAPQAQVEGLVKETLGDCRRILPPTPDTGRLERRRADRQVVEYEEQAIMQERMDKTPIPADNRKYRQFDRVRSRSMRYGVASSRYLAFRAAAEEDLQSLFASVDYLRTAPGDRHLLFLTTSGLVLPGLLNPEVPGNVACLASDAGVRIHTLHVEAASGKGDPAESERKMAEKQSDDPSQREEKAKQDTPERYALSNLGFSALASMKDLSELSGGQAFVSADPKQALSAISDATQTLYLLGYTPIDQRLDGRYRRIKVDVSAANTRVFSRGGYYATPLPAGAESQRNYSRTISALNSPELLDDIRLAIDRLAHSNGQDGRQIRLEMTMGVQPEMLRANAGRLIGKLSVAYFFLTEDDKVVAQAWDVVEMNLEEGAYRQLLKTGVKLLGNLPLPADLRKGRVKVVVYSPQADLLGSGLRSWKQ